MSETKKIDLTEMGGREWYAPWTVTAHEKGAVLHDALGQRLAVCDNPELAEIVATLPSLVTSLLYASSEVAAAFDESPYENTERQRKALIRLESALVLVRGEQ